jgi:predicted PurR-regulated permease PerM
MDGSSNQGSEHMHNWLRKLKESQERRRDEKIRRYNDVVSKLIILLIGVCIVCVIVIAALVVQNENLRKSNNDLIVINKTNFESQQSLIYGLQNQSDDRIQTLEDQNKRYQEFILSNRTLNVDHTVYVDPASPKVSKIFYNNSYITVEFADGNKSTTQFVDYAINIQ